VFKHIDLVTGEELKFLRLEMGIVGMCFIPSHMQAEVWSALSYASGISSLDLMFSNKLTNDGGLNYIPKSSGALRDRLVIVFVLLLPLPHSGTWQHRHFALVNI
jgi:hypothetical protein